MPPFNHLHPAIVHFPIALLTVAPLLVLLGLLWPAQRRGIHASALLLLVLGFGGLVLALETGDAVERYARATPALLAGVREHELAAQWATLIFGLLGATFAVLWVLPLLQKRALSRKLETGLLVLWLLLSAAGVLAVGRTGHLGGHLVHDLHTHAYPEPPSN
ncbi:MAG: hypothetical protein P4L11_10355 [Geothrix sp.]|nr:hypothetical protein [Geothrix sp.]